MISRPWSASVSPPMLSGRAHSGLHPACQHQLEPFIRGSTAISNLTTLSLSWEGGGWRLAHDRSPTLQVKRQGCSGYFALSAMDLVIWLALQLTPCSATCTTEDFVNVLESLTENYARDSTDAYRSYLNGNLRSHGAQVVLCALLSLLVAEWMHLRHSKLTSDELRRIRAVGHCTFAVFVTIPRLGMIIARTVDIVVVALGSPALMFSLVLTSMLLALNHLLLPSGLPGRTTGRPGERPPARAGAEPMTLHIVNPFEDHKSPPIQAIVVDIEVSVYEDVRARPGLSDSMPDRSGGKGVIYVLSYSP